VLGLMVLTEEACHQLIIRNPNIKTSYVRRTALNADVLALGSSNVQHMVNPAEFTEATGRSLYNLASSHASFAENLGALHLYLTNNSHPGYILLGITLPDLAVSGSSFHPWLFAPFMDDKLTGNLVRQNDASYYWLSRLPLMRYAYYNRFYNPYCMQSLYKMLSGRNFPYSADGYFPAPDDGSGLKGLEVIRQYRGGIPYRWGRKDSLELEQLLGYAGKKRIRIIAFETPFLEESKKYFRGREKVLALLEKQLGRHGVSLLTFDTLKICGSRSSFVSVFHTAPAATAQFTRILGKTAEKLLRN
jgi:hypothetical protein